MNSLKDDLSKETTRAWARLLRVSQSLISTVEGELKSKGFPPLGWYDALLELKRAGDEGLRPFELQREMLLAQYSISRLTDRLLAAGLIERHPHERDGRGQVLVITTAGKTMIRKMWPAYRAAIRSNFAEKLTEKDTQNLAAALRKLA